MTRRFILVTFLMLSLPFAAAGQDSGKKPPITPRASNPRPVWETSQDITMPEEMRIKLAIERAEGEHRRFLEDVKKLDELSVEVAGRFRERGQLSSDDFKKVSSIEKLAKRVLSHAGGKEFDRTGGESKQVTLSDAIEHMSAAIGEIKKNVMAETRHVVSATLIASANEVINLSHIIRRNQRQAD